MTQPPSQLVTLTVRIARARDLRAADPNGLSDPYVILRVGECAPWRSEIVRKTLNPNWSAAAIFAGVALDRTPYATADVWDSDMASADDHLGRAIIPLAQVLLASAGGMDCELTLGRRSPRSLAKGSVWIHIQAVPDIDSIPVAGVRPPGRLRSTLPTYAEEFKRLCLLANARPLGLGSPTTAELLETRIGGVVLEFLGSVSTGCVYVSNARLIFAPDAEPATGGGGGAAANTDGGTNGGANRSGVGSGDEQDGADGSTASWVRPSNVSVPDGAARVADGAAAYGADADADADADAYMTSGGGGLLGPEGLSWWAFTQSGASSRRPSASRRAA